MPRIFVTGDTHGQNDITKVNTTYWPDQKDLNRDDILIVCGDWGGIWDGVGHDRYIQKWWKDKPFTVAWIDGNHENFALVNQLPMETWHGGIIHRVADNIVHLTRGQVFEFNGEKYFTMGGARSVDKMYRTPYVSWWPEEIPSATDFMHGFLNLAANGSKVDYVLTHEGPQTVVKMLYNSQGMDYYDLGGGVDRQLDSVAQSIDFKHWFFGHHHMDKTISKYTCCYQKVFEITSEGIKPSGIPVE